MTRKNILSLLTFLLLLLYSCTPEYNSVEYQKELGVKLADSMATKETVNLFYNLKQISGETTIFGHQHTTKYGIGWCGDTLRSDVKDVTGHFPGMYGWDFDHLFNMIETGRYDNTKDFVVDAYNRGGVNTFAWHFRNPVTGRTFYDTTIAVKHIIPGGSHHNFYKMKLEAIAHFSKNLFGKNGELIPVIFRPYHEFDGSWFWWGKNHCTEDEFKTLWQFTVNYLRDTLNVTNFLYAFSTDRKFNSSAELLTRYPGDEYVDILALDDYWDFTPQGDGLEAVARKLGIIDSLCKVKNKLAAFSETGMEKIPDTTWWTEKLAPLVSADSLNITYVMVWRNVHKGHFYAPYKGHPSSGNFIRFMEDDKISFEHELPELYNRILIPAQLAINE